MFYIASKLISTTTGFLFPAYSSYKAVRTNDSQAIETWLMYWVVMACLHTLENTVEWVVNWFPFYYEIKSIFIVWLTIPQIQGSTYVYLTYIHPFLEAHESEIDETLAEFKTKASAAGLDYMRRGYNAAREAITKAILAPDDANAAAALQGHPTVTNQPAGAPPTLHDPLSGPTQQAWSFAGNMLRSYGPAALAAGQAVLRPLNAATVNLNATRSSPDAKRKKYDDLAVDGSSARLYPQEIPRLRGEQQQQRSVSASAALIGTTGAKSSSSAYSSYTRAQLRQRRLELERELAALDVPTSSFGGDDGSSHNSGSAIPDEAPAGPRSRHISAPTFPPSRTPPNGFQSNLEGSVYENINGEDIIDSAALPRDWGQRAATRGWRGAPPTAPGSARNVSSPAATAGSIVDDRAQSQPKRQSWFWSGSAPTSPPSVPSKKDA